MSTAPAMGSIVSRLAQARVRRVVTIAALVTLVPLWTLAIFSVQITQANAEREVLARARTTAAVSAVQIQSEINGLAQLVESFASRTLLKEAILKSEEAGTPQPGLDRHLEELKASRPGIANTALTDIQGTVIQVRPETPAAIGKNFAFRDWYKGVSSTHKTYVSEAFQAATAGNPLVVTVVSPVNQRQPDGSSRTIAYLAASYGLDQTQVFGREVAQSQGITVKITDRAGVLLADGAQPPPALVNQVKDKRVAEALAGRSGTEVVEAGGQRFLSAYAPVPEVGWAVVTELPAKETVGRLDVLRNTVYAITVGLSLVLLAGLGLLARLLRRQKETERELEESASETTAILEAAQDAFISLDNEGVIVRWSRQAEILFGWSAKEVIGKRLTDNIIPSELREAHDKGIEHYRQTGEGPALKQRIELDALHADGHRFPVELVIWPVAANGEVSFSAFLHDISERRAATKALAVATEQAQEASRLKSEFLANMSHEIRTPMNGVIGMGTLLLQTKLDDEQRDYVETIRRSADALLTIINDILDFSKIEAGRLELETIDFNVRLVAEEAADLLSDQAHSKNLELVLLMQPNVPQMVAGDPGRLRQVMLNLLSNAVKFTDSGEIVMACRVEDRTDDDVVLRFEITDTGPGIAPDVQGALFESFSQADASTTRRHGGTGLGLAICKQLAELMGGSIGVETMPGRGSTFWFTARFAKRPDRALNRRGDLAGMEGLRVVVVDDNQTNRKVLEQQLKAWKMTPVMYADPQQALRAMTAAAEGDTQSPYDVALLDYNMPEMDGLELACRLRGIQALKDLPMVLLTSSAQRGEAAKAERAGINAYLTKPVRQSALYDCLALLVNKDFALAPPKMMTAESISATRSGDRPHLLVAEDNPVNQKVAVRTLEKLGYRADVAANGSEAVEALKRVPYAAVLMDCQMPEMDGYEATRAIRASSGPERLVPIIAMTAAAMEGDEEKCRAAGMTDYIAKPVQWEQLQSVLTRYVRSQARTEATDDGPDGDSSTLLDMAVVRQLQELGTGNEAAAAHLQEMVRDFITHTDERLVVLGNALNRQNFGEVAAGAHMLRGSLGAYGARTANAHASDLEQAALNRDLAGANEALSSLRISYAEAKTEVTAVFLTAETPNRTG